MSKSKIKKNKKDGPVAYVPENADLNFSAQSNKPPKTKYEKRKVVFGKEEVKNLTKGKYGRHGNDR